jgi:integrase
MARRANGQGHIKKGRSGYEIQLRTRHGKRIYKQGGRTLKEAQKKLDELKKQYGIDLDETLTFRAWLENWLENYSAGKAEATLNQYKSMLENHVFPALGLVLLSELKPGHFSKLYKKLSSRLSPSSIHTLHSLLSAALNRAVNDELLFRNVLQVVDKPRKNPAKHRILSPGEFRRFYALALESKYKFNLLLMLFGGLRRGEALGATWAAISLKDKTLTVKEQITLIGTRTKAGSLKTKNSYRTIIIPEAIIAELSKVPAKKRKGYLCPANYRKPNGLYLEVKRIGALIGVPELTPHGLRHTHASQLLRLGEPLKDVSNRLGHGSITVTGDIYAHEIPGSGSAAADKMDKLIERAE